MGCRLSADALLAGAVGEDSDGWVCEARHVGADLPGAKGSAATAAAVPREDFRLRLHRGKSDYLGASLGNTEKGAVIFDVQERGLLHRWNLTNPDKMVRPGFIITEVNGVTGYWPLLDEVKKPGVLSMVISATPPRNAGPRWFEEIEEMGKSFEKQQTSGQTNHSPFMIRLGGAFSSLPTARAGDCGVDQCAICLEDVDADEHLVQLPCRHAFHSICAARWLTEAGSHAQGKRQCCPLCCQKVVCSPEGVIAISSSSS